MHHMRKAICYIVRFYRLSERSPKYTEFFCNRAPLWCFIRQKLIVWLIVALDGAVEDEKIRLLVNMSYVLTKNEEANASSFFSIAYGNWESSGTFSTRFIFVYCGISIDGFCCPISGTTYTKVVFLSRGSYIYNTTFRRI